MLRSHGTESDSQPLVARAERISGVETGAACARHGKRKRAGTAAHRPSQHRSAEAQENPRPRFLSVRV